MNELTNLVDLMHPPSSVYFTRRWHRYFDKWIPWIIERGGDKVHPIQDNLGYIYAGDLEGYLTYIGIDKKYHYPIMRLNGMESMTDFNEERNIMVIPEFGLIDQIMATMDTENQNDDDTDALW